MNIRKSLYVASPIAGTAVYAGPQCYLDSFGGEMIESIRLEAQNNQRAEKGGAAYYCRQLYRRKSLDNGKTWKIVGDIYEEDPLDKTMDHPFTPSCFRDEASGNLYSVFSSQCYGSDKGREAFSDAGITHKRRIWWQLSKDKGETWTAPQVLRHGGPDYDDIHWGPGLQYGKNGGLASQEQFPVLADGTMIFPITVDLEDGKRYQCVVLRGRWTPERDAIDWEFGDYISMRPDQSSQGCCEPMPAALDDGRLFLSLRCCGDWVNKTFPSLKYWVMSEDGGRTFSAPRPLTYEDGAPVWSPSSYAGIIRSSVNKKYYYLGNILDKPTYDSQPRHPLCIAELLPDKGALVRDSVTVIDDVTADAPARRRYTNFGFYEDRFTKEIILTLPEQPKTSWEDFTADCYRYAITL